MVNHCNRKKGPTQKIVHKRLLRYFLDNNILSDYQYDFLPGRSTQIAIFELLKQVYSSFNNKKIFGSICLDISKAFDCINHLKLFDKMKSCGISDDVLKWFKSYFCRTQSVSFNDKMGAYLGKGTYWQYFHKLESRESSLINAANHLKIFLTEFEICFYEHLYFLYIRNPLFPIVAFISMFWQLKVNMFYPKNSFPIV